jgi:hypothetical protein
MLAAVLALVGAAGAARLAGPAAAGAAQPVVTRGLYMGELVGPQARVAIIGTEDGTRFDVRAANGQTVAAGLTADQVAALLPGQDPRGAMAEEPMKCGPLMLAEPTSRGIE